LSALLRPKGIADHLLGRIGVGARRSATRLPAAGGSEIYGPVNAAVG